MNIDYLPGVRAGAKIDLSRWEKNKAQKQREKISNPEDHLAQLKKELAILATEVNGEFGDFLDEEGQIVMNGRDAVSDSVLVEQQEDGFALEAAKTRTDWRRDKKLNPASLTEMTLTLILHKFLKSDFIVARASDYDDYNNGVDQVIIDKRSGALVCGFDEVITPWVDGSAPKKEEKLKRKMLTGGASLKYGATVIAGRLERRSLNNVPAFYLALSKEDLARVLTAAGTNQGIINQTEQEIFERLTQSLSQQAAIFENDENMNPDLKNNLLKFKNSLAGIKAAPQADLAKREINQPAKKTAAYN